MSAKTNFTFKLLNVVSWILFIGLCIEAGGFLFNTLFTLLYEPAGASKFWREVNLSALYYYNQSFYVTETALLIIVAILKAVMFYSIVHIFHNKKLNLAKPFNEKIGRFISNLAYLSIGIGLFCFWGAKFTQSLMSQGLSMPDLEHLRFSGADVWLFMGVILLVFANIFKKGVELQIENELTV